MYKTLLAVASVVALAVVGVMYYPAKELARVQNERITAVVFDQACKNEKILAQYAAMGAPEEVLAGLKAGTAQAKGEEKPTAICVTKEGPMGVFPGAYFIVDELGNAGYLTFEPVKPMKNDHILPGLSGA